MPFVAVCRSGYLPMMLLMCINYGYKLYKLWHLKTQWHLWRLCSLWVTGNKEDSYWGILSSSLHSLGFWLLLRQQAFAWQWGKALGNNLHEVLWFSEFPRRFGFLIRIPQRIESWEWSIQRCKEWRAKGSMGLGIKWLNKLRELMQKSVLVKSSRWIL